MTWQDIRKFALASAAVAAVVLAAPSAGRCADEEIDWTRARGLYQKQRSGQTLNAEDKAYLDRAMKVRAAQARAGRPPAGQRFESRPSVGFVPLTDRKEGTHKGEDGGLYGKGSNEPPPAHKAAAMKVLAAMGPLNAKGEADPAGKIVMMSVGMSNTTQEYSAFLKVAAAEPAKSPRVVLVDGAGGGADVMLWLAKPEGRQQRRNIWDVVPTRLSQAGVTAEQVQIVWIKQAKMGQGSWGEFPAHARKFKDALAELVVLLKKRLPNLRVAYLSSRIYAGYATGPLNPEPYAYEGAFSVRWLIQDQIAGKAELNCDPAKGEVKAPILLWGPYLWADGEKSRADGLVYRREDLAGDGTHPSATGQRKVAALLLQFFKTDPLAKGWFCGE